jgi:hypothetical protein
VCARACMLVCVCVMTTFKVSTVESNCQLQKEFENRRSELSVLFDTVTVDVAMLKCSTAIDHCTARSCECLAP